MKLKALILGALILFGKIGAGEPERLTGMWYMSLPGNWVGGGETKSFLESENCSFRTTVDTYTNSIRINLSVDPNREHLGGVDWSATFAAPNGEVLVQGIYKESQRYPFQKRKRPGLCISGAGRGNNHSVGEFEILEIVYNEDGDVESFAANFIQYGAGYDKKRNEPAMFGGIRYNSSVPFEYGFIASEASDLE